MFQYESGRPQGEKWAAAAGLLVAREGVLNREAKDLLYVAKVVLDADTLIIKSWNWNYFFRIIWSPPVDRYT